MNAVRSVSRDAIGEGGYSLVELLVVLGILGLLSLLVSAALNLGVVAWGAGGAASLSIRQMVNAQTQIRFLIGHAFPSFTGFGPGARLTFQGDAHELTFLSKSRDPAQPARIWVQIATRNGSLRLTTHPELKTPDGHTANADELLLPAVSTVSFSYYADDKKAWVSQWQGQRRLPKLVRVDVAFAREGRLWPLLIVPLRVQADADCSYDSITHACLGG